MKTIIAGSRSIHDKEFVYSVVEDVDWDITEVVTGCADGVDGIGIDWAYDNDIEVTKFDPTNPSATQTEHSIYELGSVAFVKRNTEMAEYADAAIIVYDGESNGTADMIDKAEHNNLEYIVHTMDQTRLTDFNKR